MTKTYAVPPPPPHNEGKTVAAYTLNYGVVLGALLVGLGMVLPMILLVWIGAGVIAVAIVLGIVLSLVGLGQPRRRPAEAEAR
ncbi:HGxxPAAW family protein [Brachybacterium sacelli]|uniref:Zn-dependent membrane protease YugP n=2 Tax=Brachybacterium sacelli TaxID=173364 RepID=A0ABS4X2K3_9MICO|nr:HGxxPAAW family protein [Brachybacterium sacelli]MBP2382687.1 Zn-dependent membrane protease YugP [Brachybacterium sacelli]